MLWVCGHNKYFNSFSADTVFIRLNLTSTDVRFRRIKTVPALKWFQIARFAYVSISNAILFEVMSRDLLITSSFTLTAQGSTLDIFIRQIQTYKELKYLWWFSIEQNPLVSMVYTKILQSCMGYRLMQSDPLISSFTCVFSKMSLKFKSIVHIV